LVLRSWEMLLRSLAAPVEVTMPKMGAIADLLPVAEH
jgi:hypothetical protein